MVDNVKAASGADTSTLFSTAGTKSGTSGIKNAAGSDLYAIYGRYTSGTKSTTGLKDTGGNDLGQVLQPLSGAALMTGPPSSSTGPTLKANGTTPAVSLTASPTGGTGVYSYAWSFVGGTPPGCTITNATSQTCTVNFPTVTPHDYSANATVKCVVTDSSSATASSGSVFNSFTGPP